MQAGVLARNSTLREALEKLKSASEDSNRQLENLSAELSLEYHRLNVGNGLEAIGVDERIPMETGEETFRHTEGWTDKYLGQANVVTGAPWECNIFGGEAKAKSKFCVMGALGNQEDVENSA